jgi:predicted phage tail protein
MTRRLPLGVGLAVLGGLLLAAGAPGQGAAPDLATVGEPDTVIDSGPPGTTSSSTATFTFHSDDPLATFECRRDGGSFTNCSSGKTYNGLPDGSHTFEVQATGVLGTDPSPASYGWTISTDSTAPQTTIQSGPSNITTSSNSATFTFNSNEAGSTFECRRDGQAFTTCSSPKTYSGLAIGGHTFFVRATDAADNTGPAASSSWTVAVADNFPPDTAITSLPIGTTSSTSATFTFTSSQAGSTFECRRDAQLFGPCPASKTYNGLSLGSHTFYVRATDPSDNTDGSPATETWTVVPADPFAPETTITSGPIGTTSSTSATFAFTSSDVGSTFECRRNLTAFIPCSSPITYSGLADGTHTFEVRATDPSDNVDATPAVATWTVASSTGVPTVGGLRAVAGDHRVRLVWTNPVGIGVQRIEVRRGSRQLLLFRGRAKEFTDIRVFNDRTYTYSVVVFDDLGNSSPAAGIFALPHGKLRAPADGRAVLRAPMLRWMPRARATYYNVQLFRNGKKILSRWPAGPRFQLRMQWHHQGRLYRLRDGRYLWYVFPGFGKRAADRYGHVMGHSTFFKR